MKINFSWTLSSPRSQYLKALLNMLLQLLPCHLGKKIISLNTVRKTT